MRGRRGMCGGGEEGEEGGGGKKGERGGGGSGRGEVGTGEGERERERKVRQKKVDWKCETHLDSLVNVISWRDIQLSLWLEVETWKYP